MSNETEVKATRNRLPLAKQYVNAEGAVIQLGAGKPTSIKLSEKVEGEAEGASDVVDFATHVAGMTDNAACVFAKGIMAVINGAIIGITDVAEAIEEAVGAVESAFKGEFSDRGGERGLNYDRFATILAAHLGVDTDTVKEKVKAKEDALSDEDFTKWIATIRSTDGYKAKQAELFPRKPKGKKKQAVDVADLLGL